MTLNGLEVSRLGGFPAKKAKQECQKEEFFLGEGSEV